MAFDARPASSLIALDAEQAVIGAVLFDNEVYYQFADFLKGEHFHDPIHQMIFETAVTLIRQGRSAGPVLVASALESSSGFIEVGGKAYLESCCANVPSSSMAKDYARHVFDVAILRGLAGVGTNIATRARASGALDDPMAQIAEADAALRSLADTGAVNRAELLGRGAGQWLSDAEEADGSLPGVSTGLRDLDNCIGGLQPGSLFVLAGRASMGKTAAALGIGFGACKTGVGVHMASLEMDRQKLWTRMLSDIVRDAKKIPYSEIGRRKFFPDEIESLRLANDVIKAMPFSVDDQAGASAEKICLSARRAARKFEARGVKLGLVIVDYLQMIPLDRAYASSVHVAVGMHSKAMKQLARDLGCSVLLLSQLSRAVESREDKRPGLSDLRNSGEIEQDADVVGFVLRPEYYVERDDKSTDEERADARGVMKIFIDKNRQGPIRSMDFDCDISTNSIRDKGALYYDAYGRAA